jgi:hypothetical protein
MDWLLVLEFAKALSPVVAALVVAFVGLHAFRRQKRIERRLDWYGQMHQALGRASNAYVVVAHFVAKANVERRDYWLKEAFTAVHGLQAISDGAWLYADQTGFDAVMKLNAGMATIDHASLANQEDSQHLADTASGLCNSAATALSAEMRRELGLRKLSMALPPTDAA